MQAEYFRFVSDVATAKRAGNSKILRDYLDSFKESIYKDLQ